MHDGLETGMYIIEFPPLIQRFWRRGRNAKARGRNSKGRSRKGGKKREGGKEERRKKEEKSGQGKEGGREITQVVGP